jgi:hypothetical protein
MAINFQLKENKEKAIARFRIIIVNLKKLLL